MTTMKTILSTAAITGLIIYIFDEELQPFVDSSKAFIVGLFKGKETKAADGANGTAGINERGDVILGTNRMYQIPIRISCIILHIHFILHIIQTN